MKNTLYQKKSILIFQKWLTLLFFNSCDNHFVIEAKEPEKKLVIEFETERGHDHKMFKDEREKDRQRVLMNTAWDSDESDEDFKSVPV